MKLEDIERYLPQYLKPGPTRRLVHDLQQFPENIQKRTYSASSKCAEMLLQGDGVDGLMIVNLPEIKSRDGMAMIISNACDISKENKREYWTPRLAYCPILKMTAYERIVQSASTTEQQKAEHIKAVREQEITNLFFLPETAGLDGDGLVPFDYMISIDNTKVDHEKLTRSKLFTLSNYGWYYFLFKLSIHFSRMNEGIDREESGPSSTSSEAAAG